MTAKNVWSERRCYKIKIRSQLDRKWLDYFAALSLETGEGHTVITVDVADQSALHGLFSRIRDLGLSIISVSETERAGNSGCSRN